jgi:hypothetical protein
MKLTRVAFISMLGVALATPSFAQPAPAPAPATGGMGGMGGMGPGQGKGFAFNKGNTAGWKLMTVEERTAHHDKMLSTKTYEECKAVQEEHHKAMEERAKEKGTTLPATRHNGCDRMKARGLFK